jgi:hypothetical protein
MGIPARHLWAHLHLLDRQLISRDGQQVGNVDDLEIDDLVDGQPSYVRAVLSGAGPWLTRIGSRRLGDWLRWAHGRLEGGDPCRIAIERVSDIGAHVSVSFDADEIGTLSAERWMRDHVVGRIPGARHEAE